MPTIDLSQVPLTMVPKFRQLLRPMGKRFVIPWGGAGAGKSVFDVVAPLRDVSGGGVAGRRWPPRRWKDIAKDKQPHAPRAPREDEYDDDLVLLLCASASASPWL